jgi:hypothetical protein
MNLAITLKQAVPVPVKRQIKDLMGIKDPQVETKKIKPIEFWLDVVSGCNLRCTACPVGMPEFSNSIGQSMREMDLELFEKICLKAKADTGGNLRIGLYNWTEPTLHSRLDELIAIAIKHDIPCGISSNLNYDYDWAKLKPLKLWNFTITVSGFTQKTYAINHRGGRIEPVLANLIRISETLSDWESYKDIDVRYLVFQRPNIDRWMVTLGLHPRGQLQLPVPVARSPIGFVLVKGVLAIAAAARTADRCVGQ